jgi:hypothetical protein
MRIDGAEGRPFSRNTPEYTGTGSGYRPGSTGILCTVTIGTVAFHLKTDAPCQFLVE